jgi:hypothetical protein
MIFHRRDKNLGFVLQPPERFAVQDLVAIALKRGSDAALFFFLFSSSGFRRKRSIGREIFFLPLFKFFAD